MKPKLNRIHLRGGFQRLGLEPVLSTLISVSVLCSGLTPSAVAQVQSRPSVEQGLAVTTISQVSTPTNPESTGTINGTVLDEAGAVAVGARVQLTRPGESQSQEVVSGEDGQFSFGNVLPGPFQLTITAPGFGTKLFAGVLQPGTSYSVPAIALKILTTTTTVKVGVSPVEVAEMQIKQQEKQRVLGIVPNFYVTYAANAAPLSSRQKFQLAWKSQRDPFTFIWVGVVAGIQQGTDQYPGFEQGSEAYAKRYAAAYATHFSAMFLGRAVLPSVLKQDPRYFYQGTGSTGSRLRHALAYSVVRKGNDGRSQPNYSGIIGSFAAGGLSYLYYPAGDRSAGSLVQNSLLGIAGQGVFGVFQEFVLRKFTSHSNNNAAIH